MFGGPPSMIILYVPQEKLKILPIVGHELVNIIWSQAFLSLATLLQDGMTALMIAAGNGHLEVVQWLISSWASVDAAKGVSVGVIKI